MASPREIRDQRREMMRARHPDLVRDVRLRDPLSGLMREEGWAPESLFAEALLRADYRSETAGGRVALCQLSQLTIMALGNRDPLPLLAAAIRVSGHGDVALSYAYSLCLDQIRNASDADDPYQALGTRLQLALRDMRAEPLLEAIDIGWAHSRAVRIAHQLFGDVETLDAQVLLSLVRMVDRARMALVGDSARAECLVGADEKGLVLQSIRKLSADDQARYRYQAGRVLPEVLNDGRDLAPDMPTRAEQWVAITPEHVDRLLSRVRVDLDLLGYFEQEVAERQRYQLAQATEVVIEEAGVDSIVIHPPRPYARKLQPNPSAELLEMMPAYYLPAVISWQDGGKDFASLIIARGVGERASRIESTMISSAERIRPDIGTRLGDALLCLVMAVYRDLVVADVREGHYVRATGPGTTKKERRAERSARPKLLPRIVYENRTRRQRRAEGLPAEPRLISAHIRRLHEGFEASERAQARASEWQVPVPSGYTFVGPFYRPRRDDAAARRELERPVYRSWSAYDLLIGSLEEQGRTEEGE